MNSQFKVEVRFEERRAEGEKIRRKYPDRCGVLVERAENCHISTELENRKYLVPADLTFGQFCFLIRKQLALNPDDALFLFTKDKAVPSITSTVGTVYKEHFEEDNFLYLVYSDQPAIDSSDNEMYNVDTLMDPDEDV